jgi:hypothetical protein
VYRNSRDNYVPSGVTRRQSTLVLNSLFVSILGSSLLAGEILKVWRRPIFAGGHRFAVCAQEIVLVFDLNPRIVFRANGRALPHGPLRRSQVMGRNPFIESVRDHILKVGLSIKLDEPKVRLVAKKV